jgi:DNA polymerase-3 subunit delta'
MTASWDILGHEWAVDLLEKHLSQDHLRHAYLFTGPDGIGRRTMALRFAQAINHPDRIYVPQDTQSQQIARMQHPDLSVIQRQVGDRDLKIEAVRELQRTLSFSPYTASYRIALLLDFEQASESASNALLKTLEEPPGRVVMMVTAESADALLPTIVSRCEVIRLRPVRLTDLAAGLQQQHRLPAEQARLLAHISNGRPGTALHLAQNPEILEQRSEALNDLHSLLTSSRTERFAYANKFYRNKPALIETLTIWLTYWRDILQQTTRSQTPLTNLDRADEINLVSQALDTTTAHQATLAVESMLRDLRTNIEPRLAAEALLLKLPRIS